MKLGRGGKKHAMLTSESVGAQVIGMESMHSPTEKNHAHG